MERKMFRRMQVILTLATCCAVLTACAGNVHAVQEKYTRLNPVVTVTQLENVLKQTGITVYTNKEKQEVVTRRKCKNRNVFYK